MPHTRLCLITPAPLPDGFPALLTDALAAGDVASLLIAPGIDDAARAELTAIAIKAGVAAILVDTDDPGAADGVHIGAGINALKAARKQFGDGKIVGAGDIRSRHDAMTLGETLPDYLFFGRIDGDEEAGIHAKALELASWWSELFEIPAIVMGGSDPASAGEAALAGIEFVALRRAVWDHPAGPARAVAIADGALSATRS